MQCNVSNVYTKYWLSDPYGSTFYVAIHFVESFRCSCDLFGGVTVKFKVKQKQQKIQRYERKPNEKKCIERKQNEIKSNVLKESCNFSIGRSDSNNRV